MDILSAPRFEPFAQDGLSQIPGRAVIELRRRLHALQPKINGEGVTIGRAHLAFPKFEALLFRTFDDTKDLLFRDLGKTISQSLGKLAPRNKALRVETQGIILWAMAQKKAQEA